MLGFGLLCFRIFAFSYFVLISFTHVRVCARADFCNNTYFPLCLCTRCIKAHFEFAACINSWVALFLILFAVVFLGWPGPLGFISFFIASLIANGGDPLFGQVSGQSLVLEKKTRW